MKSIFKKIVSKILQFESKIIIKKYNPKIVGVTGSVGKTSTKDAIFSVLATSFYVRKSEKSFNSDIGIPLTVIGCENAWNNPFKWFINICKGLRLILFKNKYPEWLVIEVGADRPGDIRNITKWLKPDVAVLTRFAKTPVHVEFFANRDALIREKKYLVDALKKNGVLIANIDDADVMEMKEKCSNRSITYGVYGDADIKASNIEINYTDGFVDGMIFKVEQKENIVPILIKGSVGIQNIYSSLAAIAVGFSQNINFVNAGEGLLKHEVPKGRMRIIKGIKNTTILDDSYNSSPVALEAAMKIFTEIKTRGRKIAMIGDMMELGKHSVEEHYEAGQKISECVDFLFTVGIRSRKVAEGALNAGLKESNIFKFDSSSEAGLFLQSFLLPKDFVLIKGSQSVRMEKIVEEIMAEPEKASELLVRQEEEWKKR